VQLALGKAETKDILEEQKKNLSKAFQEVKDFIKND
jgi:predicted nucleic acid-binding OB-fold protein